MQDTIDFPQIIAAAFQGDLKTVEALIAQGADVDLRDVSGRTPLHWAAIEGHLRVVQFLILKGANLNAQDYDENTALSLLSPTEDMPMIDLLIAGGALVDLRHKMAGSYPHPLQAMPSETKRLLEMPEGMNLHNAARLGRVELLELLLDAGRDVNEKDPNRAPLHWAVIGNKCEAAEFLLRAGAAINIQDKWNRTPLWIAAAAGLLEVTEMLLAHGADPNARDLHGRGVLHVAVDENWGRRHDNRLVVKRLVEHREIKINANEPETGRTALHIATCTGNAEVVKVLLGAGADPERRDNRGLTPLELARDNTIRGRG